jgi:hypothetical protein
MSDGVVLGQPVLNPTPQYRYVRTVRATADHPSSIALISCWREFEAKGGMRIGRDIPSRAIVILLPHILITETVDDWQDARIRLAGTALMERFGRDIAGSLATEIYADDLEGIKFLLQQQRRAMEVREPCVVDTRIFLDGIAMMHLEIALMPIQSPDGAAIWNLVGAFRF